MCLVIFVHLWLSDICLFVKETFCEGMVFTFNSVSFTFSYCKIKTSWLVYSSLRLTSTLLSISLTSRRNTRPFTVGNLYKFAEEDLIISTYENIFLRVLEILCSFSIFLEFLEISFNIFCVWWFRVTLSKCIGNSSLSDLVKLLLVDPHLTADMNQHLVIYTYYSWALFVSKFFSM